jgi:CRISPR-associated protein Cas2
MFVIVVYDISVERVDSVRSYLRRYLNWIQNSVFEGELTESELLLLTHEISERIDPSADSVRIYILKSEKFVQKINIGITKGVTSTIL